MTQANIAKKAGLTRQAISYKVKRGMTHAEIIAQAKERKGLAAKGQRNKADKGAHLHGVKKGKHSAKKRGRPAGSLGAVAKEAQEAKESFNSASLRKEVALANLKEIEEAQKRGELISVEMARNYMTSMVVRARDCWMGIADLTDRIRQEPDGIVARQLVEKEVRRGLEELEKFMTVVAHKMVGSGTPQSQQKEEAA